MTKVVETFKTRRQQISILQLFLFNLLIEILHCTWTKQLSVTFLPKKKWGGWGDSQLPELQEKFADGAKSCEVSFCCLLWSSQNHKTPQNAEIIMCTIHVSYRIAIDHTLFKSLVYNIFCIYATYHAQMVLSHSLHRGLLFPLK